MFGPGTVCKCPTCAELPPNCKWGKGIYAGTLLMYAQVNIVNLRPRVDQSVARK